MAQKVGGLVIWTNLSNMLFHRYRRLEAQLCISFTRARGGAGPDLDTEESWLQGMSLLHPQPAGWSNPLVQLPFRSPSSSSGMQVCLLEASSPAVTHSEATLRQRSVHLRTLLRWWAIAYVVFCESSMLFFCEAHS